jgi:hypothetical protein
LGIRTDAPTPGILFETPATFDCRLLLPPNLTYKVPIGRGPTYNHQIRGLYLAPPYIRQVAGYLVWPDRQSLIVDAWYFIYQLALSGTASASGLRWKSQKGSWSSGCGIEKSVLDSSRRNTIREATPTLRAYILSHSYRPCTLSRPLSLPASLVRSPKRRTPHVRGQKRD